MKGKFDKKVWDGIHVGYDGSQAYRIFVPQLYRVSISRDVTFMERMPKKLPAPEVGSSADADLVDNMQAVGVNVGDGHDGREEKDVIESSETKEQPPKVRKNPPRNPGRLRCYEDNGMLAFPTAQEVDNVSDQHVPESYAEDMRGSKRDEWTDAMAE